MNEFLNNWTLEMPGFEFERMNRMPGQLYSTVVPEDNPAGEQMKLTFRMCSCWRKHRKVSTIKDFQTVRVGYYRF